MLKARCDRAVGVEDVNAAWLCERSACKHVIRAAHPLGLKWRQVLTGLVVMLHGRLRFICPFGGSLRSQPRARRIDAEKIVVAGGEELGATRREASSSH